MTNTIQRELLFPQPCEQVWRAIAHRTALAQWMFPNDFEPRVGHHFTFQVPPNPKTNFEGLVVQCEVLECDPPRRLVFYWEAGGLVGTQVSFRLEPEGVGEGPAAIGVAASVVEFALEGLHLNRRLAKDSDGARTIYGR